MKGFQFIVLAILLSACGVNQTIEGSKVAGGTGTATGNAHAYRDFIFEPADESESSNPVTGFSGCVKGVYNVSRNGKNVGLDSPLCTIEETMFDFSRSEAFEMLNVQCEAVFHNIEEIALVFGSCGKGRNFTLRRGEAVLAADAEDGFLALEVKSASENEVRLEMSSVYYDMDGIISIPQLISYLTGIYAPDGPGMGGSGGLFKK